MDQRLLGYIWNKSCLPADSDRADPRTFSVHYAGGQLGQLHLCLSEVPYGREEVSNGHHSRDRTHVKDLKNILEAQPPRSDRLFIFLRVGTPTDRVPSTPLCELTPNICYGPAIESVVMDGRDACHWFNSRRQLIYRTKHGLTELAPSLSIRPLMKYLADIGAE